MAIHMLKGDSCFVVYQFLIKRSWMMFATVCSLLSKLVPLVSLNTTIS